MNTQIIKNIVSNLKFEQIITEIDNLVFVNLDCLTNRVYQNQGVNEFLFTIGSYKNHSIVFLIRDGVNCRFTGLREIIKKVIVDLNLNEKTCFIYGYEDLGVERSTWIYFDVIQMWCSQVYKEIQHLNLSTNNFSQTFAGLFGRTDMFRLKIFKYLFENYYDSSLLSYNSALLEWNNRFCDLFEQDKKWAMAHCPYNLDFEASGWVPYQKSLQSLDRHYEKYFIEIVAETDVHSNKFFTEKTLKNFYLGKPFILLSGQGSLEVLKKRGFRTFAPYVNETYDTIESIHDRLFAILQEIDRIGSLSIMELREIYTKLVDVMVHNKKTFLDICNNES